MEIHTLKDLCNAIDNGTLPPVWEERVSEALEVPITMAWNELQNRVQLLLAVIDIPQLLPHLDEIIKTAQEAHFSSYAVLASALASSGIPPSELETIDAEVALLLLRRLFAPTTSSTPSVSNSHQTP